MTLPILHLTGTPYEQGTQHGEALKARVAHNLDVYFDRFLREIALDRADILARCAAYMETIQRSSTDYFEAMRGVAAGSGFSLAEITALSMRYEILYYQFGQIAIEEAKSREPEPDGCTAFAVLPEKSANGHLLLGQSWDWIPQVQGAVLHTTEPDGLETLAFTEAGMPGAKIGFNSAGVGLCINGMTTMADDWMRPVTPFHVRAYQIMRSRTFTEAQKVITGEPRACSTNFLIAQAPSLAADIEAAPDKFSVLSAENGVLVHTNNFVDPAATGITETPSESRHWSRHRRSRLTELIHAMPSVTIDAIQNALKDHQETPFSVCRHEDYSKPPQEHYITVTAVVMDLEAKTLAITDGPPCVNAFQTVGL